MHQFRREPIRTGSIARGYPRGAPGWVARPPAVAASATRPGGGGPLARPLLCWCRCSDNVSGEVKHLSTSTLGPAPAGPFVVRGSRSTLLRSCQALEAGVPKETVVGDVPVGHLRQELRLNPRCVLFSRHLDRRFPHTDAVELLPKRQRHLVGEPRTNLASVFQILGGQA